MGDYAYEDYPQEHDRLYQEDRGYHDGGRPRPKEESVGGREYRDRDRGYERDREREREPPRDYDRRRDERDRYDRRDEDRRRPPPRDDRYDDRFDERYDERYDRGPSGHRDGGDRRDVRSDPRDYGRERRRSRSPRDRRRSRSPRDRYDGRRDDRDGGGPPPGARRERGGRSGRGRRDEYSDEEEPVGGYRPRKRQAPPDPSKYDKPLPPGAGPGYISDPFYYLRQNVPSDPAEAQRLWLEQQLRSRQMVLQQQAVSAAAASAKTQRELYIGNLVPGAVTDVALRQLFNTTLAAAFSVAAGAEPVVHVNLHSDGRYAFVEFRTPEMATAALALNGQVQLLGQTISVGRPSGYVDPQKASAAAQAAAQALAAFQAGDMDALAANATAAGMNLAQLGLANLILPKTAGDAAAAPAAGTAASREPTPTPAGATAAAAAAAAGEGAGPGTTESGAAEEGAAAGGAAPALVAYGEGDGGEEEAGAPTPTAYFCVMGMLAADMLTDDEEYESVPLPFAPRLVRAVAG